MNVDRYGNTSSGSIPLALADAAGDGRLQPGELVLMTGMGAGLTWGSALIEWTDARTEHDMKDRVLFPGQGSLEAGHGPRDRRGRARGDGGLRARKRGVGARPRGGSASRRAEEELVETEVQQPALVATSLAVLAALRARGIEPDYVVGHSVGEFAALGGGGRSASRRRSRSCASAGSRWPRRRSEQPGLDGRDPRARRRGRRGALPARSSASGRRTTTARARSSSRARTTRSTSAATRPSARARAAR